MTPDATRVLAAWDRCPPVYRAAGAAWYPAARTLAGSDRACGVIAALSPRTNWSDNLTRAARVMAALETGAPIPRVHTALFQGRAEQIARGEDPRSVLSGRKTRAFHLNLIGQDWGADDGADLAPVTIDVWAARIATGERSPRLNTDGQYDAYARAYRDAAAVAEVPPHVLQAATWCHVRGAID